MKTFINPNPSEWEGLCARASFDSEAICQRVNSILSDVRMNGDAALRRLSLEIDGVSVKSFKVTDAEIEEATSLVSVELKTAIGLAAADISKFHEIQTSPEVCIETVPDVRCSQRRVPIRRVGLYIPGGTAPLFSTVLMLCIPAKVAGCPSVELCTPCGKDGNVNEVVLYAAALCGVKDIYKIGGAQAIAAMAYGTESMPKVDKIFGPGNRYVMEAKKAVSVNDVAIDMPAGPSEVMVLADETAVPDYVAADLLSQAEHGKDSQVMLVCSSEKIAREVELCIERQKAILPRRETVEGALEQSRAVVFSSLDSMLSFAECYAPEHLILAVANPRAAAEKVNAAGSVFLGNFSCESAGDYASGTNHTLPTSGWARSYSGLNVDSFCRKMTIQELSQDGLKNLADAIVAMAEAEGLEAHANAVKIRMNYGH